MGRRALRTAEKNKKNINNALHNLIDEHFEMGGNVLKYRKNNQSHHAGKKIAFKTLNQQIMWNAIEDNVVTFGKGPAGTGKTHISIAKAADMLAKNEVNKLILSRPMMEAAGERIGFLPGDMKEKCHPYLRPMYDILYELLGASNVDKMLISGEIEISPLAYMRGRTHKNAVVVLDEMQNATQEQFKMALTRIGENCKVIVTGDPYQSDLPKGMSGLNPISEKLKDCPSIAIVEFERKDVIRSEIVSLILDRLE